MVLAEYDRPNGFAGLGLSDRPVFDRETGTIQVFGVDPFADFVTRVAAWVVADGLTEWMQKIEFTQWPKNEHVDHALFEDLQDWLRTQSAHEFLELTQAITPKVSNDGGVILFRTIYPNGAFRKLFQSYWRKDDVESDLLWEHIYHCQLGDTTLSADAALDAAAEVILTLRAEAEERTMMRTTLAELNEQVQKVYELVNINL